MQAVIEFWQGLTARARGGLVAGLVLIAASTVGLAMWAYRPDYQVLFADLAPRDASAMTAELDKLKVEYTLGDQGTSILVPRELVYKTRLKLMGGEIPLHGAVGFEVFNHADFGMTEFVQRVNYLRAVQGELTRTIQAIEGIQSARVHLAVPEQGLFKKSANKSKASVTLAVKSGSELSRQQISGIQRLVAASVPDIAVQDVTVLDQHGVALTRQASDTEEIGGEAQLEAKRSVEAYLQKKIVAVLDQTFGAGEALASVDVVLGLEQGKVTTEEVLPVRTVPGQIGAIVRQRQSAQEPSPGKQGGQEAELRASGNSSETDYQVGRRVEQRTLPGGELKRITVAVVVKQRLSPAQQERLQEVVALAAGVNVARGDAIVVNSMDQLANPQLLMADAGQAPEPAEQELAARSQRPAPLLLGLAIACALLALLSAALLVRLLGRKRRLPAAVAAQPLDAEGRARMLAEVQHWIAAPASDVVQGKQS